MKKIIFTLVAMLMMATTMFATDYTNESRVNWNENVYVSVSGAPTWSLQNSDSKFFNNVNVAAAVKVGKWLTPTTAVQLRYEGGAFEGGKCFIDHTNLTLEGVVNMFNLFGGVKNRVYDMTVNLGGGWFHTYGTHPNFHNALSATAGFGMNWNVSKAWSININPTWTYVHLNNEFNVKNSYVTLNLGVTYNFSPRKTHPTRVREVALTNEVAALTERVTALTNELETIKKDTVVITKVDTVNVVVAPTPIYPTVGFSVNSCVIPKTSYSALNDVVNVLKNDDVNVHIIGYADNTTGSPSYNQSLSERRADAVKKYLVDNGVAESHITTEGKGGVSDNDKPFLNRVVIIK